MISAPLIVLVGPPNSGKSSLFNRLTGARQKVANYPGTTVEKREGEILLAEGVRAKILDLPGILELKPLSEDEWIAVSVLLGMHPELPPPHLAIVVLDATTLERGLHFLAEIKTLELPMVIALTMKDLLPQEGLVIHTELLAQEVGAPVVLVSSRTGEGIETLKLAVVQTLKNAPQPKKPHPLSSGYLRILRKEHPQFLETILERMPHLKDLLSAPEHPRTFSPTLAVEPLIARVIEHRSAAKLHRLSEQMDQVLLHPVAGILIFLLLMFLIFQSVYFFSEPLVDLLDQGREALASALRTNLPPSLALSFLSEGVLGGVGNVISFLPQILILFFWISLLEESGYLSRVAFLLDRPLRTAGLSGKSVIPLLSGFACAVPAIMATRTIEDYKTRLLTILIIPLMTCSARLPVYTLLIGTFIPEVQFFHVLNLKGLVMFGLYALGVLSALLWAWGLKGVVRYKGIPIPMILEFPLYRFPSLRNIGITLWMRGIAFLKRAGTYIFLATLILWLLLQFPRHYHEEISMASQGVPAQEITRFRLEHSFAGRIGKTIEPLIAPLGFDWKIGIGLFASFSAREVMISILGTIYSVGEGDAASVSLRKAMLNDRRPDGKPLWTLATALSLLVFYVYALQCVSTVIIMYRELGRPLFPLLVLASTYGLGYLMSFITYRIALSLGG